MKNKLMKWITRLINRKLDLLDTNYIKNRLHEGGVGTFNPDETIQVMDLRLKEDAKKGYFGRISCGLFLFF